MSFWYGAVWNRFAEGWAEWMLAMAWQVALLAGVAWGVSKLLPKSSASFRYALWLLVFVKLVLPPSLAVPWSAGNALMRLSSFPRLASLHQDIPPPALPADGLAVRTQDVATDSNAEGLHRTGSDRARAPFPEDALVSPGEPATPSASTETAAMLAAGPGPLRRIAGAAMAVWAAVALAMLGTMAVQFWRYRRQVTRGLSPLPGPLGGLAVEQAGRLGLRRRFEVRSSPHLCVPAVFRLWRPVVLLPEHVVRDLPREQLASLVCHELAHIQRCDIELGWVSSLLLCVYWFHPAVWLANLHLRREREMACDDKVLYATRQEGKEYATTILRVAESFDGSVPAGAGFLGLLEIADNLLQPIRSVSDVTRPRRAGLRSAAALAILAALLLPMGAWTAASSADVTATVAVDAEIAQNYAQADAEVKDFIKWTAKHFGADGLWLPENTFETLAPQEREAKLKAVKEAVEGPEALTAYTALAEAGALRDPSLLPGLVKVAWYMQEGGQDNRSKWMAVAALGRLGDKSAVPVLIPLVDHHNKNVRLWARASLVRLTGQNFGAEKQAWGKWWNDAGKQPPIDLAQLKPWTPPAGAAAQQSAAPIQFSSSVPEGGIGPKKGILRFDGVDDLIHIPSATQLDLTSNFAVSAWARIDPGCGEAPIYFRGDNQLAHDPCQLLVLGGRMCFKMDGGQGSEEDRVIVAADLDGGWHLWTGVCDSGARKLLLYKDGQSAAEAAAPPSIQYPTAAMYNEIGSIDSGAWGGTWGFLKGEIDQLSVWNVVRKPEEIQGEFARGLKGDEPGLVALWTFDEDGQTINDSSSFKCHATLGRTPESDPSDPTRTTADAAPLPAQAPVVPAQAAVVPEQTAAIVAELPGTLAFKGTYLHRSRGQDLSEPGVMWMKRAPDQFISASYLPALGATTIAFGPFSEGFSRYVQVFDGKEGKPPSRQVMEFGHGTVVVKHEGGEKDGQVETLTTPADAAFFDPNTRPDPYATASLFYQMLDLGSGQSKEHTVYDWDNTGKGMASYQIRVENKGKESVSVPAGTFEAYHLVQTQLSFGDTWYKKRPGHVTDYWFLENGVVVRILRHREPYEVLLASLESAEPLPGRAEGKPQAAAAPQAPAKAAALEASGAPQPGAERGISIRGRVTDAASHPLGGARVHGNAYRPHEGMLHQGDVVSAADGTYCLAGFPDGTCVKVSVGVEGYYGACIDVPEGRGDVQGMDFALDKEAVIEGRVIDAKGRPLPGGRLSWRAENEWRSRPGQMAPAPRDYYAQVDAEARFRTAGLPSGAYRFQRYVEDGSNRYYQDYMGEPVKVDAGQTRTGVEVVFPCPEEDVIEGYIRDANGAGLPGVEVDALTHEGLHWGAKTDANGFYRVLGAGDHTFDLYLRHPDYPTAVLKQVRAVRKDAHATLYRGGAVSGVVKDAVSGAPLDDFRVEIEKLLPSNAGVAYSDRDTGQFERGASPGTFAVKSVPPGTATVRVAAPNHLPTRVHDVRIDDGKSTDGLEFLLERAAVIEGTVHCGGKPFEAEQGIHVDCLSDPDREVSAGYIIQNGFYRLDGLAPGEYAVNAWARGDGHHTDKTITVKAAAGETVRADFELEYPPAMTPATSHEAPVKAEAETVSFEVPAKAETGQEWFNTGISVPAGADLDITATGTATWDQQLEKVSPQGAGRTPQASCGHPEEFLMPTAPCGGLVGKVGDSGTPFFVGEHGTIKAESAGALYLGINDRRGHFADNDGAFKVTVVIPRSG